MVITRAWLFLLPILIVPTSLQGSEARAFHVRILRMDSALTTHYEAKELLDGVVAPTGPAQFDSSRNYRTVNLGEGTFGHDESLPDELPIEGPSHDHLLSATAAVKIPQGEWSIAFGTDGGGQITVPGIEFLGVFNEADPALRGTDDQIWFAFEPSTHNWTGGHFRIAAELETTIDVSMHRGSGAISFELAIRDNNDLSDSESVSADDGWMLLADGVLGWEVSTDHLGEFDPLDCNCDGVIDMRDANCGTPDLIDSTLAAIGLLKGDVDADGEVQFSDFVVLANNFDSAGQYTDGDFDKDGFVQFGDFVILANNFGRSAESIATAAVPEPSNIYPVRFGCLLIGMLRRCRTARKTR